LIGSTVSHYQILERLGGGGMGVVYKALDLRLDRPVALKFIASQRGASEEQKRRFIREAKAASSLDHPNICTIFEIDETEDGTMFIAMALYEGETLNALLKRGPLSIGEAVELVAQVAAGLACAHKRGIVHRDVKPANVILTSDGQVKLLDFGVAKLADQSRLTRAGTVIGTTAYISPEQFSGEPAGPPADVWSVGVMLYQLVTGRLPFEAEPEKEMVRAIIEQEPRPMVVLRPGVPAALQRIVARALAKRLTERYAQMEDLHSDLLSLPAEPGSPEEIDQELTWIEIPSVASSHSHPRERTGVKPWLWGAAAAGLALAMAGVYLLPRLGGADPAVPHPAKFKQLTDLVGSEKNPSLSPDGNYFLYVRKTTPDNEDIYLQRVEGSNAINLTADSLVNDSQPAYSPDGQQIAFRSEREGGGIFLMGAMGESVRRLTDIARNPAWSSDGTEIAVDAQWIKSELKPDSGPQLWRINVATGRRRLVMEGLASHPSWSPDGRRIAYWTRSVGRPGEIWTISADGEDAIRVTSAAEGAFNRDPVWSSDGYLYYASNRGGSQNFWRQRIDEMGEVRGMPEPITTPATSSFDLSLSHDGRRILYATNEQKQNLERVLLEPAGPIVTAPLTPIIQGKRWILGPQVSPDGSWIVYYSEKDLHLIRTDGTGLRQLTRDSFDDQEPRWSPDGRRIFFSSDRTGRYDTWSIRPDGSDLRQITRSRREPILAPGGRQTDAGWCAT
jgi:serine/threonine protein kinase